MKYSSVNYPYQIDGMLRYLETHGEIGDEQFPEWDQFQQLAADYEVCLYHSDIPCPEGHVFELKGTEEVEM